jgi:hypothetical protein
MDKAAHDVEAKSEQPQQKQKNRYCQKHITAPSDDDHRPNINLSSSILSLPFQIVHTPIVEFMTGLVL